MSDEGKAAIIGLLVFIILLLIPCLIVVIVNYAKRASKGERKSETLPKEDSLFPTEFEDSDATSEIHDESSTIDTVIIYKYESKEKGFIVNDKNDFT